MRRKTIFAVVLSIVFWITCAAPKQVQAAAPDEDLYYSFNPHVCPKKLYDAYGPEEWETFFKLCDALEAGEDTFECPNFKIYDWCFSGGPLSKYFPLARFGTLSDYTNNCSDGVGHFTYYVSKEDFMQKQKEFEQLVVDILKENVRKDYTDFEKCIALYEYMIKNYTYDWEEFENNYPEKLDQLPRDIYGTYRTFMDKKGICEDLSGVYGYLLLQCGVEAVGFESRTPSYTHSWTYVTIDGSGYFIDPTWGIPDEGEHDLDYFMMTEAERKPDFGDTMTPISYNYDYNNKDIDFSANDDRYKVLRGGDFVSLDTENKILHYTVNGEPREFHYES